MQGSANPSKQPESTVNRQPVLIATILLLACGAVPADSLPLQSVNKANAVIGAAVEAYGGAQALEALQTVAQKQNFTTYATGQSRKPGPPWDQSKVSNFNAIDLENEVFFNHNAGTGGGFVFDQGVIINGNDSWQLNHFAGTAAPLAEPDYDTQSGPFIRVTAPLLIKQLQARRQAAHWLGEAEVDGRMHDIVTLVMETGPGLALYFDRQGHMLTRMERVLPPFGQVEYQFLDYETLGGVPFNQTLRLFVNGEPNLVIEVLETQVNQPLDPWLQVPTALKQVGEVRPDEFASQEIDEGVFLIGGNGTYSLFVEMADHVVAIEGTTVVPDAIAELRKQVADKPIRYGVLTHHHSDHIPGAAAYAQEGATIVTFKENETLVREAAGDPDVKLQFVDQRLSLGDGSRTVELYDIGPTPHAEHILIAWLPAEGIIFEADHFPQPPNGDIPPAVPATVAFAAALDKLGLEYGKLVGAHSPRVAGPADLAAALNRKAANAGAGGL
jgi:glyoxylase-like metal-dependent hydrolase (beta-lactamase superfamily II)